MSWSGFATSFSVKTQSGRPAPGSMGGTRESVAGSLERREAAGTKQRVREGARASEKPDLERKGQETGRGKSNFTTHHWTCATRTGVAVEGPDVGTGVFTFGSQNERSCFASYWQDGGQRFV